jgi:hypothetical protein
MRYQCDPPYRSREMSSYMQASEQGFGFNFARQKTFRPRKFRRKILQVYRNSRGKFAPFLFVFVFVFFHN